MAFDLTGRRTVSLAAILLVATGLTACTTTEGTNAFTDIVTFVSVSIIGGAVIQYPLGYLSDRWDRRLTLLITSGAAMAAACFAN